MEECCISLDHRTCDTTIVAEVTMAYCIHSTDPVDSVRILVVHVLYLLSKYTVCTVLVVCWMEIRVKK